MSTTTAAAAIRPTQATATKARRQPACCPNQVPAGTPRRLASEPPDAATATARPRSLAGNMPAASTNTIAQNTPWDRAVTTRVAMSHPYPGAAAPARVPVTKTASKPTSSRRRGMLRVRYVSGADDTTTTAA